MYLWIVFTVLIKEHRWAIIITKFRFFLRSSVVHWWYFFCASLFIGVYFRCWIFEQKTTHRNASLSKTSSTSRAISGIWRRVIPAQFVGDYYSAANIVPDRISNDKCLPTGRGADAGSRVICYGLVQGRVHGRTSSYPMRCASAERKNAIDDAMIYDNDG